MLRALAHLGPAAASASRSTASRASGSPGAYYTERFLGARRPVEWAWQ